MDQAQRRVIVPLSGKLTAKQFLDLAQKLCKGAWGFKLHPSMVIRCFREGVDILSCLKDIGSGIFLDPKLHDIPSEVGDMTARYADMGANFITVHASGGKQMMAEAVRNRGNAEILAVTVLTSLSPNDCRAVYWREVNGAVLWFAECAFEVGCGGTVSSARDLEFLRGWSVTTGAGKMLRVCPGIRPEWNLGGEDDQKRVTTPAQAIFAGATHLVVGRPILEAADPVDALQRTNEEVEKALEEKSASA